MKTLIWTLPARIFHWLLAIGFTLAYILGDFDELRNLHFAFGALVGALIFFRLIFGLIGPRYSHFRDFPIGFKNQKEYMSSILNKAKVHSGHNPLAALIMLAILISGLVCSISGFLIYAGEHNILNLGFNEESIEELHEVLANIFLILVVIHLAGLIIDTLTDRKTGTLASIFTGYKNIDSENASLSGFQKFLSVLWFIVPFVLFYMAFNLPVNQSTEKDELKIESSHNHHNDDDDDDD